MKRGITEVGKGRRKEKGEEVKEGDGDESKDRTSITENANAVLEYPLNIK